MSAGGSAQEPDSVVEIRHLFGESLAAEDPLALVRTLAAIETEAFGVDCSSYWEARPNFVEDVEGVCLAVQDGETVGFLSYSHIEADSEVALYLDAAAVLPRAQRQGVLRKVFEPPFKTFVRRGQRQFFVVARTESPVIYQAIATAPWVDTLFPTPGAIRPDEAHLRWARRARQQLWPDLALEEETLVLRSAHKHGSWHAQLPVASSAATQSFFAEDLKMHPGDALVIVAFANLPPPRPRV